MVKDKCCKTKNKTRVETMTVMDTDESEVNEEGDILASAEAPASRNAEMDEGDRVDLRAILMEIKDFRKENTQQFEEVKAEICKTNIRLEEAEGRIVDTEDRVQTVEDVVFSYLNYNPSLRLSSPIKKGAPAKIMSGYME